MEPYYHQIDTIAGSFQIALCGRARELDRHPVRRADEYNPVTCPDCLAIMKRKQQQDREKEPTP